MYGHGWCRVPKDCWVCPHALPKLPVLCCSLYLVKAPVRWSVHEYVALRVVLVLYSDRCFYQALSRQAQNMPEPFVPSFPDVLDKVVCSRPRACLFMNAAARDAAYTPRIRAVECGLRLLVQVPGFAAVGEYRADRRFVYPHLQCKADVCIKDLT